MSGTSRDLRSAERLELKRHQEYQDLKRLVIDQAPSSNFKKGTEEAVRVKMAVAYRDYILFGLSNLGIWLILISLLLNRRRKEKEGRRFAHPRVRRIFLRTKNAVLPLLYSI